MRVGIGLSSTIAGAPARDVIAWARASEAHDFSSLAVLDRLVYSNIEPIVALAAAAAVTERIRLATTILIAPYRGNPALLAKQLASIDYLSGGRLVLGIAAGTRHEDYEASSVDYATRGRVFDDMLDVFDSVWGSPGEQLVSKIGPKPTHGRPVVLFGGTSAAAFRRAATRGDGWVMGGGDAATFEQGAASLAAAWNDSGRQDQPESFALAYFALGSKAQASAQQYLGDYYAFLGKQASSGIAASAVLDGAAVRARVRDFAAAGCGELIFVPCDPDPAQVSMLRDALS